MSLPQELLSNVYWAFYQPFDTQEAFEEALIEYNDTPTRRLPALDKIVLPIQSVAIQYLREFFIDEEDSEDDDEDRQFKLTTDNAAGFTLGELMYKINQAACTPQEGSQYDVSDQDAHFFEGLEYLTDDDPDYPGVPVYYMILGS